MRQKSSEEEKRLKANATAKRWRDRHPGASYASVRRYSLKKEFGLSVEEYDQKFKDQEGRCGICGSHQDDLKRRLAVDHDHKTKKVRELLCGPCNMMLGQAKESIELLHKAIAYLLRYSQ